MSGSDGGRPAFSEEWGEQFLAAMREYIEELDRAADDDVDIETVSGQIFCGCSVCYERETYLMATKLAILGYLSGEVRLE